MKIQLNPHSKQRLYERGIRIKDIKEILNNITVSVPARKKGRKKVNSLVKDRLLWVVYELKNNSHHIITAYWA